MRDDQIIDSIKKFEQAADDNPDFIVEAKALPIGKTKKEQDDSVSLMLSYAFTTSLGVGMSREEFKLRLDTTLVLFDLMKEQLEEQNKSTTTTTTTSNSIEDDDESGSDSSSDSAESSEDSEKNNEELKKKVSFSGNISTLFSNFANKVKEKIIEIDYNLSFRDPEIYNEPSPKSVPKPKVTRLVNIENETTTTYRK
jgi:hypothetical protein